MTDKEIIEALKDKINGSDYQCFEDDDVLDLIVRQRAEIKRLNYILWGVMHSVDKWLDGAELEQDEVNRAATMREKTLRITEEKQAEIERLKGYPYATQIEVSKKFESQIKSEAVKEFVDRLKEKISDYCHLVSDEGEYVGYDCADVIDCIDNLVKEMVGEENDR